MAPASIQYTFDVFSPITFSRSEATVALISSVVLCALALTSLACARCRTRRKAPAAEINAEALPKSQHQPSQAKEPFASHVSQTAKKSKAASQSMHKQAASVAASTLPIQQVPPPPPSPQPPFSPPLQAQQWPLASSVKPQQMPHPHVKSDRVLPPEQSLDPLNVKGNKKVHYLDLSPLQEQAPPEKEVKQFAGIRDYGTLMMVPQDALIKSKKSY